MHPAFLCVFVIIIGRGKTAVLRNTTGSLKIPETLLMKLRYVENASEFMSRFISSRNKPPLGVFLAYLEDGRSETTASDIKDTKSNDAALPIAKNAGCIPEQHLIELPRPTDPAVISWPMCTRVWRCGGCCPSTLLACQPTLTSVVNVRTIAAKYNNPGADAFDLIGYETVQLVQHEKCRCLCRVKAEDCTSLQVYSPDNCQCVCKNAASASECRGPNHHWDPAECTCKCNKYNDCSTGLFFNPDACRCESVRYPLRGLSSQPISIHPVNKEDGGENDHYHSQHIGIRPLEDHDGHFSMGLQQADRKWHQTTPNNTDQN